MDLLNIIQPVVKVWHQLIRGREWLVLREKLNISVFKAEN
jgi:hypothetical protein